jgi:Fic family protein
MESKIINRILAKKKQLDGHRPLSKSVLNNLNESLSLEWTYNSNAIEGNSLTLRETGLVLREGITISGKSLREHFEAKNHEKAIQLLEQKVLPSYQLSENDIFELHAMILASIEDEFAGRYRNGQVRITGANFIPPNALKVPELMAEFVGWINGNPEKLDIITLTARLHHRFVWIHPFFDGNGRTGRLIMNLWLMKYGFPPAIILKNDRKKYYDALDQANNERYEKLILIIAQAAERSLDIYLEAVEAGVDTEYLPLREIAKRTGYEQDYLSLLARRGEIDAYKRGRNWVSTLKSIKDYQDKLVPPESD